MWFYRVTRYHSSENTLFLQTVYVCMIPTVTIYMYKLHCTYICNYFSFLLSLKWKYVVFANIICVCDTSGNNIFVNVLIDIIQIWLTEYFMISLINDLLFYGFPYSIVYSEMMIWHETRLNNTKKNSNNR